MVVFGVNADSTADSVGVAIVGTIVWSQCNIVLLDNLFVFNSLPGTPEQKAHPIIADNEFLKCTVYLEHLFTDGLLHFQILFL